MKCRSAVVYEHGGPVVVEDLNLASPKDGEVLIRMGASGICQSDWSVVKGTIRYDLPIVLGHEGAGIIEAVGQGVTYVKPGDYAILSFVTYCGLCRMCQSGRVVLCEGILANSGCLLDNTCRFTNRSGQSIPQMARIGTMSNYAVVSENSLIKISSDYSLQKASLVGCGVTTGIGAVINTAQVQLGEWVAVIGVGGVGLNVIQGARIAGAERIFAIDLVQKKLDYAQQFGATDIINASHTHPKEIMTELTDGKGVDYAFEVIGQPETIHLAYQVTSPGGMTVVIGIAETSANIQIPAQDLVRSEKRLVGSFYGSANLRLDMQRILDWYDQGKIKLSELITQTYSLDQVNQAFDDLNAGKNIRGMILYD